MGRVNGGNLYGYSVGHDTGLEMTCISPLGIKKEKGNMCLRGEPNV
jgi:hypothetical protein